MKISNLYLLKYCDTVSKNQDVKLSIQIVSSICVDKVDSCSNIYVCILREPMRKPKTCRPIKS